MLLAFLLLLVVLCFFGGGVAKRGELLDDYMSRERTTSIKGVFAVIIVLSHSLQYVAAANAADSVARAVIVAIGQLMVTMFFFYSGYGIVESVRGKPDYMRGFFKNRIVKTLVHFDLAILLFIAANHAMGQHYPLERTLLSFTGWSSIGNSNWFVFGMLVMYLLTLLPFALFKNRLGLAVALTAALVMVFAGVLSLYKESWWYNTLICYPLGMVWSLARGSIERAIKKRMWIWWLTMVVSVGLVAFFALLNTRVPLSAMPQTVYMLLACLFCLFVAISQMRLRTNNKVLYWLGVNSFSIYILQRIPMNILKYFKLNTSFLVFLPLAFAAVMIIAPLFTYLTGRLDILLFPKKKSKKDEVKQA